MFTFFFFFFFAVEINSVFMIQAHKIFSSHLLDSLTYLSDTKVQGQVKLTKSTGPALYVRQAVSLQGPSKSLHSAA